MYFEMRIEFKLLTVPEVLWCLMRDAVVGTWVCFVNDVHNNNITD